MYGVGYELIGGEGEGLFLFKVFKDCLHLFYFNFLFNLGWLTVNRFGKYGIGMMKDHDDILYFFIKVYLYNCTETTGGITPSGRRDTGVSFLVK